MARFDDWIREWPGLHPKKPGQSRGPSLRECYEAGAESLESELKLERAAARLEEAKIWHKKDLIAGSTWGEDRIANLRAAPRDSGIGGGDSSQLKHVFPTFTENVNAAILEAKHLNRDVPFSFKGQNRVAHPDGTYSTPRDSGKAASQPTGTPEERER
jgi:hypothetical protein